MPKGGSKESLLTRAMQALRAVREALHLVADVETHDRAISMPRAYEQVWEALSQDTSFEFPWLVDIFKEGSSMFGIVADGGKLYRMELFFDGADNVTLGSKTQVVETFTPAPTQSRMLIKRQADGRVRWFLLAATAYINRNAEIDSRELFDNLARRAAETGKYPYITYYHLGKKFRMGSTDLLERDGNALIASGLFDENDLAVLMQLAYEEDPDYWGASISFWPVGEPDMEEIVPDIRIPVYRDGIIEEISFLAERDACSLFTGLVVEREAMNERVLEALKRLAGGDEELVNALIARVDEANTAQERGLIARGTETVTPAPAEEVDDPATTDQPADAPVEPPVEEEAPVDREAAPQTEAPAEEDREIVIDDAVVAALVAQLVESPAFVSLTQQVAELTARMTELQERMAAPAVPAAPETTDEQRVTEEDKPRRRTTVSYRASQNAETPDTPANPVRVPLAQIAEDTLSRIK